MSLKLKVNNTYKAVNGDVDTIESYDPNLGYSYVGKSGRTYMENGDFGMREDWNLIEDITPVLEEQTSQSEYQAYVPTDYDIRNTSLNFAKSLKASGVYHDVGKFLEDTKVIEAYLRGESKE